jgi:inositol hexakisphosphate/diphosphoinositol-pentakisphosphate kinase
VNGFSFVKNSNKYYDDTSKILGNMILRNLAPKMNLPWAIPFQLDDPPVVCESQLFLSGNHLNLF